MFSSPLLDDYTLKLLEESKKPSSIPIDPISRYNYIIEAYNNECNRIDHNHLSLMPNSSFYKMVYSLMNNFFGNILLIIILIFLPIINILMFISIAWCYAFYLKLISLYKKNEKVILDPFKNMVYSPEVCENIDKINCFFQLDFDGSFYFTSFKKL